MGKFLVILSMALVAAVTAKPGYNYKGPAVPQPPQLQQTQQVIRQNFNSNVPRQQQHVQQTNSGIYSAVQSPPLTQFSVQPQNIAAPVPAPLPQQNYLAPAPVHQQSYVAPQQSSFPVQQYTIPAPTPLAYHQPSQPHQPNYVQQTVAIPSIAQSHQQQVVQQQLSLPIVPQQQQQLQQQHTTYQNVQRPQTAIITKDIYIHSAPEEHEEIHLEQPLDNAPIRKNYRIVFIKAPTQNLRLASAALKRAQAQVASEEKTVIYVLSKKPDFSEVQQQLLQTQTEQKTHKPEVYFIKYKTQEEAQRAQQEIQAQYDTLGGSTHVSDEGVAPLTTVGGIQRGAAILSTPIAAGNAVGSYAPQQNYQSTSVSSGPSTSSFNTGLTNKYLPAKSFK